MTSEATATATAQFSALGCKMHRRHLDRLWRAVGEGLSPASSRAIFTQRSITRIRAASPGDLADALDEATEPGDPELLDNLWITARDPRAGSTPAREIVLIVTDKNSVQCTVTGDPTWVRGRASILQALIEECRPLKWSNWYGPPLSYALAGSSVGTCGYALVSLLVPEGAFSVAWGVAVTLAIALLFFVVGWIVGKSMARKCRVEIWLRREELPTKWWRVTAGESMMAVIALIAVVVAVIFGLVSHSDASDDDTKKPSVKSSPSP